jgi:hypothetical protein
MAYEKTILSEKCGVGWFVFLKMIDAVEAPNFLVR